MEIYNEVATHHQKRQAANSFANNEPENAITQETEHTTNQKHSPWRKLVTGDSREKTHTITNVTGHSENGELTQTQHRFQQRGIEREVVRVLGSNLDPNRRSQTHPRRPAACLQNWARHLLLADAVGSERKEGK
ncbi:hypothetical protein C1H46_000301 [Malus baccata]|uniref:Uncharacterized protein n=1 Tax=Malus baccata TaxID=106549 RepID=A0A540NTL4_MALBA|nr:hypothetical protein C1H46_000301 [Malus baccata]